MMNSSLCFLVFIFKIDVEAGKDCDTDGDLGDNDKSDSELTEFTVPLLPLQ